ncbi:sterol desaturase family protein [Chitinophaga ginsengisoli]|uniref:Fatty acid hydroxylase family protein n=1 Tax=Chitinophaga ginsengisoli TaxID=363837 RepID=A0A2P8GNL5_9BACT|nr:sterol desaturase family protein [Chitinophaga ginsengisoli]PSL35560.1 fatty acid hydroxylase family protein [Chitinophaga ginsengisoli]
MDKIVYYTTPILLLSVVILVMLERKYPYTKGLPLFRDGFWIDLVWYTLIQSYFLKILIFDYIILPIDQHYHLSSLQLITHWPIAAQVLFFLVTHDFYIYWFHRWQHHSKWLWRTHEAHHSGTEVDWLSGSRSHSLEILINQTIEFAPIILLGANPIVVPIKALIDAVWGMYIHSNINVKSGKLQYWINGPEMHQWHHAEHKEVYYSNFSTKLAIWDWLFGTAYLPDTKPLRFGLPYVYPKDYFLQHWHAVKKVDEKKLLENGLFSKYYYLRPNLMKWMRRKVKTD